MTLLKSLEALTGQLKRPRYQVCLEDVISNQWVLAAMLLEIAKKLDEKDCAA